MEADNPPTRTMQQPPTQDTMRCNAGIDPALLVDQHLVAESVELKMVTGFMRYRMRQGQRSFFPPPTFRLGKGHILFFTNKLSYLAKRLEAVNHEMMMRGFHAGQPDYINVFEFRAEYYGDWQPTEFDTALIRDRIATRLRSKHSYFWRKSKDALDLYDVECAIHAMNESPTFHV